MSGSTQERGHDVQRLSGVMLQGEGLRVVAQLCRRGIDATWQRSGIRPTTAVESTIRLLEEAAAMSARGHTDVRETPSEEPGTRSDGPWVDSQEAARRLNRSERHVTRIARSLNGWRSGPQHRWLFDPLEVDAYKETRDGSTRRGS